MLQISALSRLKIYKINFLCRFFAIFALHIDFKNKKCILNIVRALSNEHREPSRVLIQGTVPRVELENGVSVSTGFSLELPNFSFDYNLVPESMAALLPAALVAMVFLLVAFA